MKISTCCGATQVHPDYDICPDCLEHCEFENESMEEFEESECYIYNIYCDGKMYDGIEIIHNDYMTAQRLLSGYIKFLRDNADDESVRFSSALKRKYKVKITIR